MENIDKMNSVNFIVSDLKNLTFNNETNKDLQSIFFNKENNKNEIFYKEIYSQIIELLNSRANSSLEYTFNEEAKQLYIEIIDKKTKEVIRQFPSEEFFKRLIYF